MIDKRAVCHEAGHAIVAKNFGISVCGIFLEDSVPKTCLDITNAERQSIYVVFAGGVAAEQVLFGGHENSTSANDRNMIQEAGGGGLEQYLNYATEVIQANLECLKTLIGEINSAWIGEEAAEEWGTSRKLNFTLLSGDRVDGIWLAYHPALE